MTFSRLPVATFRAPLATLALALLLTGCGSSPEKPETIPGSFRTDILADGTKLFTYSLGVQLPEKRGAMGGTSTPDPSAVRRLPDPHKTLQTMLEQNRYCRDGYVTLEQYRMGLLQVVRGECRDAATDEDRQRASLPPPR